MERNVTKREILLKRQKKPFQTLDELMDACLATLTARIWATCRWLGQTLDVWKIGDFNYLIVSVKPDKESNLSACANGCGLRTSRAMGKTDWC